MTSPAFAVGWEIWRRNRWGFLAIGFVMVLAVAIEWIGALSLNTSMAGILRHSALVEYHDELQWTLLIGLFAMLASVVAVLTMFSYTETDYKSGEICFPSRVFHFPVPTFVLAGLPMIFGAAVIVLVFAAWRSLIFAPIGVTIPFALPAVSLVMAVLSMQALVWGLPSLPAGRLFALAVIFFGLAVANVCDVAEIRLGGEKFSLIDDFVPAWPAERIAAFNRGALIVCVVMALAALVAGNRAVERERRGRWRGWRGRIEAAAAIQMGDRKAFRSPAAAQFWFEWRRNALPLPVSVGALLLVLLGPVPLITGMDAQTTPKLLAAFFLLPIALAAVIGFGFGKLDFWARGFELSPFLSNWPLSNSDLIVTKLKVAALSVLLSWALVLVAAPLWLMIWADSHALDQLQREFLPALRPETSVWAMPGLVLCAVLLTWTLMVRHLHLGVLGRPGAFLIFSVGVNLLAAAVAIGAYVFFYSGYGASLNRLVYFPVLPWLISVGLIAKFSVAARAFSETRRRGLLSTRFIAGYLLVWLAATACFVGACHLLLPDVAWRRHLFAFAAVLLFPMARIGLAPLALAWNRHQRLRVSN